MVPILRVKSFDFKRCEIEISNFDSSFEWNISSDIGTISRNGNLISIVNDMDFPGAKVKVVTRKSNFVDGEATAECLPG